MIFGFFQNLFHKISGVVTFSLLPMKSSSFVHRISSELRDNVLILEGWVYIWTFPNEMI